MRIYSLKHYLEDYFKDKLDSYTYYVKGAIRGSKSAEIWFLKDIDLEEFYQKYHTIETEHHIGYLTLNRKYRKGYYSMKLKK